MLSILGATGPTNAFCDSVSRRSFLQVGGMAFGAASLGLVDVLRAEETTRLASAKSAASSRSEHSLIQIFLAGGPPHQDTWDLKPDAPSEIRGELTPISTNVAGIEICEVFPRLATMMDKCTIIRSIVGSKDRHESNQCLSGWVPEDLRTLGGRPCMGSAVSKLQGSMDPAVPSFVGLTERAEHAPWSDCGAAGFLGAAHTAFKPDGPAITNMKLGHLPLERLQDRQRLLKSLDHLRRDIDISGAMDGMDAFEQRALDVLTSSKLVDALDLSKEDPKILERYGDGKPYQFQFDGVATRNDHFLIARRLVEAGVRVVSLSFGRWDSHFGNFDTVRDHGGKLDQALSALIEDLDQRGMLATTSIVVWGEFGRTPKINSQGGRDHWPQVSCALLAGGGMKMGQVLGATNRLGEYAVQRPTHVQEVIATLYHNLGINVSTTTINDPTGRPQFLVDHEPIAELI